MCGHSPCGLRLTPYQMPPCVSKDADQRLWVLNEFHQGNSPILVGDDQTLQNIGVPCALQCCCPNPKGCELQLFCWYQYGHAYLLDFVLPPNDPQIPVFHVCGPRSPCIMTSDVLLALPKLVNHSCVIPALATLEVDRHLVIGQFPIQT